MGALFFWKIFTSPSPLPTYTHTLFALVCKEWGVEFFQNYPFTFQLILQFWDVSQNLEDSASLLLTTLKNVATAAKICTLFASIDLNCALVCDISVRISRTHFEEFIYWAVELKKSDFCFKMLLKFYNLQIAFLEHVSHNFVYRYCFSLNLQ